MRTSYPRPDFERDRWFSLNGLWKFNFKGQDKRNIQVPYVYQSALSGINDQRRFDYVTYCRHFTVPSEWKGECILLHFGAVDYRCDVFVNDKHVCTHEGGCSPFTVDITSNLTWKDERIVVEVYDPSDDETIPRGKQYWREKPEFIWYTPSTGIWQSVWIEPVPISRFESIKFTPDIDRGTVEISYILSEGTVLPVNCSFSISLRERLFYKGEMECLRREGKITVDIFGNRILDGPFYHNGLCWSPEHPNLFDVEAVLKQGDGESDKVHTYFGMRKISIENGKIYLNNYPYYPKLVLDQGYWKDSLLTAPDDDSFKDDILKSKAMGFNGCRKHEKAEDPQFLYWADKLGYLVWSAMPSFISYTPEAAVRFVREWCAIIQRDYNHPSIFVWEMLNESWGVPDIYQNKAQQAFAVSLYKLAHALDSTRLVIDNDGWEQTVGDICAFHSYRHGRNDEKEQQKLFAEKLQQAEGILDGSLIEHQPYAKGYSYQGQPIVITEFGGISVNCDESSWGYTSASDESDFLNTYNRLISNIHASKVICGFCYTQFADVQQEKNGLLTEDHKFKFSPEEIKKINDRFHY